MLEKASLVRRKEYLPPVIPAELCMIQDSQGREVDCERMGNDTEHIAIVERLMVEGETPLRRAASKKDARSPSRNQKDTKRTILRPLTLPSAKRLQLYSHTVLDERFTISQTDAADLSTALRFSTLEGERASDRRDHFPRDFSGGRARALPARESRKCKSGDPVETAKAATG